LGRSRFEAIFVSRAGARMSEHRQVWETLSHLLQRVENSSAPAPAAPGDSFNLEQEIRKLAKTQHKANLLSEEQNGLAKQTLALGQSAQEQNVHLLETLPRLIELPALRRIPSPPS